MLAEFTRFWSKILISFEKIENWWYQCQLRRRVMSINFTAVWPGLLSTSTTISAWQSQKKLGTEADPRFLIATENQIGIFVVENSNFSTGKSCQQQNMPIEHAVLFLHMRGVGKILRQLAQTVQSVIFAVYLCWCWGPYWHDPSLV